ncbi:MAG: EAL domain-containing protein [Synechococcaceae cyanobacterium SM2_3_1]|nr:EAL domain-containing protein [Synechococcaceae cyanobacterium SM2_3_1]
MALTMAFQPIVDVRQRQIYAYEALVRGVNGESAGSILSQITDENRYRFDQTCRVTAVTLAKQLNLHQRLHINFLPNAVYSPENCIRVTLETAQECGFPSDMITFEIVESEKIDDYQHLNNIIHHYKEIGFLTAMDDFGSGYSGFNALAEIRPNMVKLDIGLVRNVHASPAKQAIIRGLVALCEELSILMLAEGVETVEESQCLLKKGITLQQGYLFSKPGFQSLPEVPSATWDLIFAD